MIFGARKFHSYLSGRSFVILTDHKLLLGLLGESKAVPHLGLSRMIRWTLLLQTYEYQLRYLPGEQNQNADALSRLPF